MNVFKVPVSSDIYTEYNEGYYGGLCYSTANNGDRSPDVEWHNCREVFHSFHPRNTRLLFVAHGGNTKRVISFIHHAEQILKLSDNQKAIFTETTIKGVLLINMGIFWRAPGRKSLFSILLRAAQHYKSRQFYDAARKDEYLDQTWKAFTLFMRGHTYVPNKRKFTDSGGWRNFFRHKSTAALKINLVKPNAD